MTGEKKRHRLGSFSVMVVRGQVPPSVTDIRLESALRAERDQQQKHFSELMEPGEREEPPTSC